MINLKEEKSGLKMYELNCMVGLRHTDRIKEIAQKIESWVEKKKGEMAEIEKSETPEAKGGKSRIWVEKKRLAYPVQKDNFAYFLNSWVWLKPEELNDLKRFLKLEKEIIRFFILTRENASIPAPLRDAVPLDNAEQLQLEERRTQRKAPYVRKPVEMKPEIKPEIKPVAVPESLTEIKEELKDETAEKIEEVETKELVNKLKKTAAKPKKKADKIEIKEEVKEEVKEEPKKEEKPAAEDKEKEKKEKAAKRKKITLEELDKRLDDILNEDIL